MGIMRFYVLLLLSMAALSVALVTKGSVVHDVGKANFWKYREALPKDFDVVKAGGWNQVEILSVDPKSELVRMIVKGIKTGISPDSDRVDALVGLLQARGKGFDAGLVDGEWAIVLNRSGKDSPKLQKFVQKTEKVKTAFSNFDVKSMIFVNSNFTPHGRGELKATVKYVPVADGFTRDANDNVVVRRIMCDIVDVSFKYSKLPKLPLPLRSGQGFLDFLYLDEDIRVTRGNRGGLFVHFRPDFLDQTISSD